jgi:hypothetical protein
MLPYIYLKKGKEETGTSFISHRKQHERNRAYFQNGGSDFCHLRSTLLCPLSGIAERIMEQREEEGR